MKDKKAITITAPFQFSLSYTPPKLVLHYARALQNNYTATIPNAITETPFLLQTTAVYSSTEITLIKQNVGKAKLNAQLDNHK